MIRMSSGMSSVRVAVGENRHLKMGGIAVLRDVATSSLTIRF